MAKLSPEQQADIWRRVKAGETQHSIARDMGVSQSAVSYYSRQIPVADKKQPPLSVPEQILHLRGRNSELGTEIARLRSIVGEQREFSDQVKAAVAAAEPYPRIKWHRPAKPGKPVIPVLKFSDWQIGQMVLASETEGFGEFNWEIAQRRVFTITDGFLRWVHTMRYGYRIDECRILVEGDMIEGDVLRDEAAITNEFPAPVQTARTGLLLGEAVARVAPHFGHVKVVEINVDNHGRTTRKPMTKRAPENTFNYLVHTIANQVLAKHPNVETFVAPGMKHVENINGFRFLIEHGHTVKSWMGIPYYGMERERAREATKRMGTDLWFHYQSIAHWHVAAWVGGNMLINGSLPGTSEFDHSCGRHAPPSQVAFLVHPEHGAFNFTPFRA